MLRPSAATSCPGSPTLRKQTPRKRVSFAWLVWRAASRMSAPRTPCNAHGMARPSTHQVGDAFEAHAVAWLIERGWRIDARNVRRDRKEIDVIASRGRVTAFIEVKGRRGDGFGHPLAAVTWKKRREIEHVARRWLGDAPNRAPGRLYRFDVISIRARQGSAPEVEHVADAWRLGE